MSSAESSLRRHIRATPDPTDYAEIDTNPDRESFQFEYVGLILDESPMSGCSIIAHKRCGLKEGQIFKLRLGRISPLRSEVVWLRELDEGIYRYGIRLLE